MSVHDPNLDAHIYEARLEDARFMFAHGESAENVARRLGITEKALEKMLERA